MTNNPKKGIFYKRTWGKQVPVLHCADCGNRYLHMEKFRGKCYFCVRKLITRCKN